MQRIFITGANRGLGLEITKQYLAAGAQVVATARQPAAARELQALRRQYAERLVLLSLDLTDDASIAAAAQATRQTVDGLDVLINNAGVYQPGGQAQSLGQLTAAAATETFTINALGPLLVTQALLPLLRAGSKPRIVSISSGLGSLTWKASGDPYHYSASKAALNMYMRSLAAEVGNQGILSVVVDPGWLRTGMGGAHATQDPSDSARGIIRLAEQLHAEENGSFVTWQNQPVPW